jgi:hypothetical protein
MTRERMDNRDVGLLMHIMQRSGLCGRMTLPPQRRSRVVPLWRRGLIEVWYRCAPDEGCMHGPYFNLTVDGHRVAAAILAKREDRPRATSPRKPSTARPRPAAQPQKETTNAHSRV